MAICQLLNQSVAQGWAVAHETSQQDGRRGGASLGFISCGALTLNRHQLQSQQHKHQYDNQRRQKLHINRILSNYYFLLSIPAVGAYGVHLEMTPGNSRPAAMFDSGGDSLRLSFRQLVALWAFKSAAKWVSCVLGNVACYIDDLSLLLRPKGASGPPRLDVWSS